MKTDNWLQSSISNFKPIGIVILFSPWLVVLFLFVSNFSSGLVDGDKKIIGDFIEWFGTAYSLFLALVLANAWTQFENVDREFDQELDSIATLHETAKFMQNPNEPNEIIKTEIESIEKNIKDYTVHVIKNYQIEDNSLQQRRNGEIILEDIGKSISRLARVDIPEPLISELFRSLNQSMDIRGDRISHSKQRIPKTVWLVAFFSSILWLLPFLALDIDNQNMRIMLIGGVTFVITIVLIIVSDLDSPYEGAWKIDLSNWTEFLETIELTPQIIFVFKINSGAWDRYRAFTGGQSCRLWKLSQMGFMGASWKELLNRIKENFPKIKFTTLYANQFSFHGYEKRVNISNLPSVVIKKGDEFKEILNAQDISSCPNLFQFETMLDQNIIKCNFN